MTTQEIIKKVRRIEIKTRGISNQIFSGSYHSAFKGKGMSFSEVREYQVGDDVRQIDWNVTARLDSPFIKVFEEERELTVMMLIDVSQSAYFGSKNALKSEIITEISAVLSFSAIQNNDKVGVLLFSNQIELFIPPKKGKSHILRIIRELIAFEPAHKQTKLDEALKYFSSVMKKRCITFLLSDFIDKNYANSLKIAARKHDLIGIQLYDRHEESIPNIGLAKMLDAETGQYIWVNTGSKKVREQYMQDFAKRSNETKQSFLKCGADFISLRTDQSYVTALMNLFKKREQRR